MRLCRNTRDRAAGVPYRVPQGDACGVLRETARGVKQRAVRLRRVGSGKRRCICTTGVAVTAHVRPLTIETGAVPASIGRHHIMQTIIGIVPHIIVIGMPQPIIFSICMQHMRSMSIDIMPFGIIMHTMP